jgi:hypothetical protein
MSTLEPVFYFGCWGESGHYLWTENRQHVWRDEDERARLPKDWRAPDGTLCPGAIRVRGHWEHTEAQTEGRAMLHWHAGWTAIAFWDRSVDTRMGCNSVFMARGRWSFEAMIEIAKARFPSIWQRFKFQITHVGTIDHEPIPVPALLFCPWCRTQHIDEGEWLTKPHHVHTCGNPACGKTWRVEPYCVGVRE